MPTIDGVQVFCSTSDGKLQEYVDPERQLSEAQGGREKTCYIEATEGQHFTFTVDCSRANHLYDPQRFDYLGVQLSIDGTVYDKESGRPRLYGYLFPIEGSPAIATTTFTGLQYEQDHWDNRIRRFQFSNREIDCEHDERHHGAPMPDIGEITVKIARYKKEGTDMNPRNTFAGLAPHYEHVGRVYEKHVKGLDVLHQVTITQPQVTAPRTVPVVSGNWVDDFLTPFMTFRFLYRSKRALRSLGFIERSPSPLPPPSPDGLDTRRLSNMSLLELQREIRRLEVARTRGRTLKRESTESRGSRESTATLDLGHEPRGSRVKREATEIIDLGVGKRIRREPPEIINLEARGKRIKRGPPEIIDLESTEGRSTEVIELD